ILGYVIAIVLWSAVLLRQYALATGHPAETSSELSTAVRRVPAMALLGILTGCAVAVWFLPTLALQGTARLVTALVLAIPACYLVVALSCGGAVLLVTGRGPLASLVHSFRLTSGSFWRLTSIYTVAFVLLMVLYLVSGLLAGLVSVLLAHGDIAVITAATTVFVVILSAVGTPFFWALALAVLGDLSVRTEGAERRAPRRGAREGHPERPAARRLVDTPQAVAARGACAAAGARGRVLVASPHRGRAPVGRGARGGRLGRNAPRHRARRRRGHQRAARRGSAQGPRACARARPHPRRGAGSAHARRPRAGEPPRAARAPARAHRPAARRAGAAAAGALAHGARADARCTAARGVGSGALAGAGHDLRAGALRGPAGELEHTRGGDR